MIKIAVTFDRGIHPFNEKTRMKAFCEMIAYCLCPCIGVHDFVYIIGCLNKAGVPSDWKLDPVSAELIPRNFFLLHYSPHFVTTQILEMFQLKYMTQLIILCLFWMFPTSFTIQWYFFHSYFKQYSFSWLEYTNKQGIKQICWQYRSRSPDQLLVTANKILDSYYKS